MVRASAATSPPPSPSSVLSARLVVAKAEEAKSKAKKAKAAGNKLIKKETGKGKRTASTKELVPAVNGEDSDVEIVGVGETVNWAKPDQHHLTFALLALISDNATWKVALGFDKGAVDGTCTQGKKLVEHHRSIAEELFLSDASGQWTEKSNLIKLGNAVKNRITSLKSTYRKNHATMSDTGQGLLDEGREEDIVKGSEIANVWDAIKKKSPWYMEMHRLMGTSPVVDRSAIGNSVSPLDLDVLGRHATTASNVEIEIPSTPKSSASASQDIPPYVYQGSDDDDNMRSPAGSPGFDGSPPNYQLQLPSSPHIQSTASVKKEALPSRAIPTKRKNYHDQLRESGELERASRERIAAIQTRGKTERQDIKEGKRRKLAVDVEDIRSRHLRDENFAMREHELAMMDKKLELARLQLGPQHSPHYGQSSGRHSMSQGYGTSSSNGFPSHGYDYTPTDNTNNTFSGYPSNTQHSTILPPYDAFATDSTDTATASTRSSITPL